MGDVGGSGGGGVCGRYDEMRGLMQQLLPAVEAVGL